MLEACMLVWLVGLKCVMPGGGVGCHVPGGGHASRHLARCKQHTHLPWVEKGEVKKGNRFSCARPAGVTIQTPTQQLCACVRLCRQLCPKV